MEVPFEFHRAKATWVAISKYFEIQFGSVIRRGLSNCCLDSRPFCIVMVFLIRTERSSFVYWVPTYSPKFLNFLDHGRLWI